MLSACQEIFMKWKEICHFWNKVLQLFVWAVKNNPPEQKAECVNANQENNVYRKWNRLRKYLSQIPQCEQRTKEHTDGEVSCLCGVWVVGFGIFFFFLFCSGRQIGFLHLFIFQVCWSQVILAYPMFKRFCFHTVVLPCSYCFQLNRSHWFKPGGAK